MKKTGSTSDFTAHRNRELHASFIHVLRTERGMPLRCMFAAAASRPASRFWVSARRAADVIGRMRRGDTLEDMNETRRRMFREIFRRVILRMEQNPGICMTRAVDEIVFEPAPEFYLTPESARSIIYRCRAKARQLSKIKLKSSVCHDSRL